MAAFASDSIFAKLVPANADARKSFSHCVEELQTNGDEFHLRVLEDSSLASSTEEAVNSDTGVASSEYDTDVKPLSPAETCHGHFILSFEKSRLPNRPNQGWTVGKGANVDFLLARPGSPIRRHVAQIHVVLRFNRSSGLLMLVAASSEKPVKYLIDDEWVELRIPSQHVLYKRVNKLRISRHEYDLIYTWPPDQDSMRGFYGARNTYLESHNGLPLPHDELPGIPPKEGFQKHENILIFNTSGSGGFGWISNGVDVTTGEPVAIKEVRIKSKREIKAITDELRMGRAFQGIPGLLPTIKSWCEHGQAEPCGLIPERTFLVSPLGTRDFKAQDWERITHTTQMCLFHKTLVGLNELHHRGFMHRDVTQKNLLILSAEKPDAVVFDYGKAIYATDSDDTFIGPITTLAPEVYARKTYTNKIDVWAWAYAMSEVLGYKCANGLQNKGRIDLTRHTVIRDFLRTRAAIEPQKSAFIELLNYMLDWTPENRPSIKDALRHRCWSGLDEKEVSPGREEVLRAKRVRTDPNSLLEADRSPNMSKSNIGELRHKSRPSLHAQRGVATPASNIANSSAAGGSRHRIPMSPELYPFNEGPTQPFSTENDTGPSISASQALRGEAVKREALASVMQRTTLPGQAQQNRETERTQLLPRK